MSNTPIVDADLAAADRQAEILAERARTDPKLTEKPSVDPAREQDLDSSLAEVLANTNADGTGPKENAEPAPEPKPDVSPEPKPDDQQAPEPKPDDKPKGALDDLLSDASVDQKPAGSEATDPADEIKLRSDASPKTRETFDQLKKIYKERLDAANAKHVELETRLKELEAKSTAAPDPTVVSALENEVKELRAFRAQFDTANDPAFQQKYDARIASNYETIYSTLTKHQLPASELEKLKAMPREERDEVIASFFDKLPFASKSLIQQKLYANAAVADDRERELGEARAKADQILAEKAKAPLVTQEARLNEIRESLRPVVSQLPFLHLKPIPPTAGAEEKKALEAHNAFAQQAQQLLRNGVLDDSPRSRADAAIALPLAHFFKRELDQARAQLKAANEELEGIRKAGRTSRTANSISTQKPGAAPAPKAAPVDGGDALDQLFQEATGQSPRG